jgi:hypothetical protein
MIISLMFFHLPLAFYEDTKRRYKRMEYYNNPKRFDYDWHNDFAFDDRLSSSKTKYFELLCRLSSYIGGLFPLFILLDFHWILLILMNLLLIGPANMLIVIFSTPQKSILSFSLLKPMSISFIVLGIIFYLIGIFTF